MKALFFTTILFFVFSSYAATDEIVLRNGEIHYTYLEVNGKGSGDIRPAMIICENGSTKYNQLNSVRINRGAWVMFGFNNNNDNNRASYTGPIYDLRTESLVDSKITCLNEAPIDGKDHNRMILGNGEIQMALIEINGEGSGLYRPAAIICENGSIIRDRLVRNPIFSTGFWPSVGFNNGGSVASGDLAIFNPVTQTREMMNVECSDEGVGTNSGVLATE